MDAPLAGLALIARGRETGPSRILHSMVVEPCKFSPHPDSLHEGTHGIRAIVVEGIHHGFLHWEYSYELGMDGMGCIMLALTALIMPVSIAASQRAGYNHEGFAGCLLMIQGTLVGVFTAQNFLRLVLFL